MTDLNSFYISCLSWQEIGNAVNRVTRVLDRETGRRLVNIFTSYLVRYNLQGVFERLNDKSVAQIFAEFDPGNIKPIISGERDEIRYRLYDAPSAPSEELKDGNLPADN